jgi:predicted methyltransferase
MATADQNPSTRVEPDETDEAAAIEAAIVQVTTSIARATTCHARSGRGTGTITDVRHLSVVLSALSLTLLLGAAASPVSAQPTRDAHEMHHMHGDPAAYIEALEDPARDAYQKPHEVMQTLAIRPGEVLADIGSGSGYFTLRLAHHVGTAGRVYAVDINPEMIRHLDSRARDAGLSNVRTILARPDDPLLPEPVDRFLVVNVWHHIDDRVGYLTRMASKLKPGGQVIVIDFHKRDLPVGPPVEMKIAKDDLITQMAAAGFQVAADHTFLPYQYFLIFERRP